MWKNSEYKLILVPIEGLERELSCFLIVDSKRAFEFWGKGVVIVYYTACVGRD